MDGDDDKEEKDIDDLVLQTIAPIGQDWLFVTLVALTCHTFCHTCFELLYLEPEVAAI